MLEPWKFAFLQRDNPLISAKNVLYTKKMSNVPHPSRSLWGALFFGLFRETRN
jgi:hypothetical protein